MPSIFTAMLTNMTSLFICMGVGYLCRKIRIIDDAVSTGLSRILLYVALPCTAFVSMMREFSYTLLSESMVTLLAAAVIFLCGTLIGAVFAKMTKSGPRQGSVWKFALTFPNVGYAGFPIMLAVYGQTGLIYTAMVNAAFNILVYSLGLSLYSGAREEDAGADGLPSAVKSARPRPYQTPKTIAGGVRSLMLSRSGQTARRLILNPALLATALGFVFFLSSRRPPEVIGNSLAFLSGMTTPLSMIIVGAILAKIDIRKAFTDARIYVISLLRLAVIPLAAFAALRLFVENPVMLGVLVYLAAMPVGAVTAIFAEERGGDSEAASRAVFVSTLISMVTIPLMSTVIGYV